MDNYILDADGKPIPEQDIMKWAMWMGNNDRHVAKDYLGNICISTVFLGTDHNFLGLGTPILWETMIFGFNDDEYQERYTSKEAAIEGHKRALACVREKLKWMH